MSTQADANLRERLAHVYWMGGSPCAGKSSTASLLSGQFGLKIYSCDDAHDAHVKRAQPDSHPTIFRSTGSSWDEIWMRPVESMAEAEIQFYREEFELITEDLLALPADAPVLAEGSALLPQCVAPLLLRPHQSIWVVPSEEFQREQYARREWVAGILEQCQNPDAAFQNWMGRDAEFARRVTREAGERALRVLEVDGSRSISETSQTVAAHFNLDARV
ncbi:MAG TPA: hypothetical protein VJT82_07915 [Pyrinomonadaceae bacterium]|nr:hypothetical protein [Pyrinomonadaceae bacterium]